ncbi:MAG TPA: saccharopine dehydrogenase NADP-binding domain-containing protein [Ramlibacter sp.]|nr:saccharopine dehydrogenase NADP-binding domain-containing protein [Ramlibacter sp.]
MDRQWMLYGATGYTGRPIVQECVRRGLRPVLAGRDAAALAGMAEPLGLAHVVVALDDGANLAAALRGLALVLHCAGPFSATSAPMRKACLAAGAHYLDITGEIDAFVDAQAQDTPARAAGVLLCPGVGFDVVPTDCVAACLRQALPDANQLTLGFSGLDSLSAGTTVTSMEAVFRGRTRVRQDGRIVDIPFGERDRKADFGRGLEPSYAIPWGDVATAYWSTGIPDIEVLVPRRSPGARAIRAMLPLRELLAGPGMRGFAYGLLRRLANGPSAGRRAREQTRIWGEARNAAGQVALTSLQTPNGYTLTVLTALMAVRHVLEMEPGTAGGYRTPTQLMGPRCIEQVEGVGQIVVER